MEVDREDIVINLLLKLWTWSSRHATFNILIHFLRALHFHNINFKNYTPKFKISYICRIGISAKNRSLNFSWRSKQYFQNLMLIPLGSPKISEVDLKISEKFSTFLEKIIQWKKCGNNEQRIFGGPKTIRFLITFKPYISKIYRHHHPDTYWNNDFNKKGIFLIN